MIYSHTKTGDKYITPEHLADLRDRCRCTQLELAERSGVQQANISAMEGGRRLMTLEMFERLRLAAEAHKQEYETRMSKASELAEEVFERPHLVRMREEFVMGVEGHFPTGVYWIETE